MKRLICILVFLACGLVFFQSCICLKQKREGMDVNYLTSGCQKDKFIALFFMSSFKNDTVSFYIQDNLVFENEIFAKIPRHGDPKYGTDACREFQYLIRKTNTRVIRIYDSYSPKIKYLRVRHGRLIDNKYIKASTVINQTKQEFLIPSDEAKMIIFNVRADSLYMIIQSNKLHLF